MNRRGFLSVVVFLTLTFGAWMPATAQNAEQEVRKAESDRFAAMLKGDLAALERLLAPELIYTHGDGRVVDKAAFIADLKTGDFKYVSIDAVNPKVRVFGDTAIVNGVAGMSVVNRGAPAKIRIVYSTTQLKRNGAWQMISWHATRLAQ
jgi:Domain of unknown function (DUF4440)